ncbi:hypothetical protein BHU72_01940 [Desulfuribacillus stibiiarsenatis]|uniref:HNH nuclease domain-containing protein n=1 Tax=Desulfuribacillus stibiiarsenatis TaxID=1390249 RepID=A0A1E5L6D0_9FIRM|nr:HNH endonuclease [Desulfuribacillus stibiiarsenatis]OEH85584.1 hypothetical protein BHU72_01940 [Desulfuribacillus stibiiarsenatis]
MGVFNNFLNQIDFLKVNILDGKPAFKKPLLLLLLISRLEQGILNQNKILFQDIEEELSDLIVNFGGRNYKSGPKPNQPFQYLNSSEFWNLHLANGEPVSSQYDLPLKLLCDKNSFATLDGDVYKLLQSSAASRAKVAHFILEKWWTDTIQQELVEVLKIPMLSVSTPQKPRNRDFTEHVLANYRYKCAICGFQASFNKTNFGIDGAHIKWFSQDGPDTLDNGLALCKIHHWAFDKGVISINSSDYKLQVSSRFVGRDQNSIDIIEKMNGRDLLPYKEVAPSNDFIEWHSKYIFLG